MLKDNSCKGCYWEDQCGRAKKCRDYMPIDDGEIDLELYYKIIEENTLVYQEFVEEFHC